jgi:glycosyltransferase involved in cell wall biosynthesis
VCLYAGNLDRYQGWQYLIEALAILRRTNPNARLLIATESDPSPVLVEAQHLGVVDSTHFCRLDGERARKLAHAASDLTWVPRRTEGGLPIKMLDAFARELPVVAMSRATAALPLNEACTTARDDDAGALAAAAQHLLENERAAMTTRNEASRYLATHHSVESFACSLRELLGETGARPQATRLEPHRRAFQAPRAR